MALGRACGRRPESQSLLHCTVAGRPSANNLISLGLFLPNVSKRIWPRLAAFRLHSQVCEGFCKNAEVGQALEPTASRVCKLSLSVTWLYCGLSSTVSIWKITGLVNLYVHVGAKLLAKFMLMVRTFLPIWQFWLTEKSVKLGLWLQICSMGVYL